MSTSSRDRPSENRMRAKFLKCFKNDPDNTEEIKLQRDQWKVYAMHEHGKKKSYVTSYHKLRHITLTLFLHMVQEVYFCCHIVNKCVYKALETWAAMSQQIRPDALDSGVASFSDNAKHFDLALHYTVWSARLPFLSSEWFKGRQWNRNAQSLQAVDNPLALPTLLKLAESKISRINGTCSYLGVSSTYQSPSATYLQESGTGGIQEGLV